MAILKKLKAFLTRETDNDSNEKQGKRLEKKYYDESKTLLKEERLFHDNGLLDISIDYDKSGKVKKRRYFNDDGLLTLTIEYENGKAKRRSYWTKSQKISLDNNYHPNGELKKKTNYVDGKIVSQKEYDKKGLQIFQTN